MGISQAIYDSSFRSMAPAGRRESWVEIFRTLAAVFVAGSHVPAGDVHNFLMAAHVPVFFIFCGYFVKSTDWESAAKRILLILVPYILWSAVSAFLLQRSLQEFALNILYGPHTCNAALWFLRDLMFLYFLVPIIKTHKAAVVTAVSAFLIWQVSPSVFNVKINTLALTVNFPQSLFWFFLGVSLQKKSLAEYRLYLIKTWAYWLVAALVASALTLGIDGGDSWIKRLKPLGCMGFLALSVAIDEYLPFLGKLLTHCAKAAFICFVIHCPILQLIGRIDGDFIPWGNPAYAVMFGVVSVVISVVVYHVIAWAIPWTMPYLAASKVR